MSDARARQITDGGDLRRALDDLVQTRPAEALALAQGLAASPRSDVRAIARWAIGWVRYEQGDLDAALASYAAALAEPAVAPDLAGRVRLSRAIALGERGATGEALAELDLAAPDLPEGERPRALTQRAFLLFHLGRYVEALDLADEALAGLRARHDRLGEARLLLNRGVALLGMGRLDAAGADFEAARLLAAALGQELLAAGAVHNLGALQARRGDVPGALHRFDAAEAGYVAAGRPARVLLVLETDRCEALLAANLVDEARAAAGRAVEVAQALGNEVHHGEARLLLARACLAAGDGAGAEAEAERARGSFVAAGRPAWAAAASYVALQAVVLEHQDLPDDPPAGLLARALEAADVLEGHGWEVAAAHARVVAGRLALAVGDLAGARATLAASHGARRRGSPGERADAWHALALSRLADGDPAGARRAVTAGLRTVARYRDALGANELRAAAASHARELSRLGLRLAVRDARPAEVLRWAERTRAAAVTWHRQAGDDEARRALRALRLGPDPIGAEAAVRTRSRTVASRGAAPSLPVPTVAGLRRALAGAVLVEYVECDGDLAAVVVGDGPSRVVRLGPVAPVAAEVDHLGFARRRLLAGGRIDADRRLVAARAGGRRAGAALVDPLGLPPGSPVVLVPTGALHGCPWPLLPSLGGRPVVVAPSAARWLAGQTAAPPRPGAPHAVVVGPGLPGADDEARVLGSLHGVDVVAGPDATVERTLRVLAESAVVHLAAHGRFRADSPMFSSVLLADGPLTLHDLEHAEGVPHTLVLPACDAASASWHLGDELIGTAAALLGLGVRTVVAPVGEVPDGATAALMVSVHRGLAAGRAPAEALAAAAAEGLGSGDPDAVAAAGAFVCLGAGW